MVNVLRRSDRPTLAYHGEGAGPPLVFAHCLGGSRALWTPLIERLRHRYRCIAYDLRGQGESVATPGPCSMADHARDLRELFDHLGIERGVLIGVSMGGMVAQEFAALAPERLAGLVLADTAAGFDAAGRAAWDERMAQVRREGLAPLVETMMARWFTPDFRQNHRQHVAPIAATLAATEVEAYAAACAAIRDFDMSSRLAKIVVPTLVLCGENDPSTPLPLSRVIADGIAGARLVVLPGLQHLPMVEAPERVSGVIDDFLQSLPAF